MDYVSRNVKTTLTNKFSVPERRKANRAAGRALVAAGIPVVPTRDKVPLPAAWPKLDSEISDHERQTIVAEAQAKNGFAPMYIGSTLDASTVDAWTTTHDFTPSVSLGAAGLTVLDLDIKNSVDGVESGLKWLAEHGVDIEKCPRVRTQSGGLHVYFSNPGNVGCGRRADLQWDLKGAGGQVVAPGAVRESDGKRYTAEEGAPALADAFRDRSIPPIPDALVAMFRGADRPTSNVTKLDEARGRKLLNESDWPDFGEITDSDLGDFDLEALAERDAEWRRICTASDSKDMGGDDSASGNLFNAAKCLHREFGDKLDLLTFASIVDGVNEKTNSAAFGDYVGDETRGQGQFNHRDLVRAFENAKSIAERRGAITDGSAFTPVEDEETTAETDKPAKKRRALVAESFDDAVASAFDHEAEPLVAGWLDQGAMSVIYGDSNAGKSFVALHLGLHVATGRRWNDCAVAQGLVVYVAAEGGARFKRRLAGAGKHLSIASGAAQFALVRSSINLSGTGADAKALVALVRGEENRTGQKAHLVIIDTLSRALAGGDENSSVDMGRLVQNCDAIREATGAHLMLIHHTGKDQAKGARGHSLLRAATDSEFEVKAKTPGAGGVLTVRKQRDQEFAPSVRFALVNVPLADRDGRFVSSACVELGAGAAFEPADEKDEQAAGDLAILATMIANPNGSLSEWAVASQIPRSTFRDRIVRLAADKLVKNEGGKWVVRPKGRKLVSDAHATSELEDVSFETPTDDELAG